MSYETWYQNNRFHKDRRKKCLEDWARERWSWLLRAVTEISQAQQSHAGHQLSRDEALRQKFKCEMLRQRVCLNILTIYSRNFFLIVFNMLCMNDWLIVIHPAFHVLS